MRNVLPVNTMAIAMGLHPRCGNEDTLWGQAGREDHLRRSRSASSCGSPASSAARSPPARKPATSTGSASPRTAPTRPWPSSATRPTASPASSASSSTPESTAHTRTTEPGAGAGLPRARTAPHVDSDAADRGRPAVRVTGRTSDITCRTLTGASSWHRWSPRAWSTAPPPAGGSHPRPAGSSPWVVFALTFGLLLSDYMSRQVLSAVFPFLKLEWALTDTQLGALTSVVALTVGLLAVPLSLLGDRWGRVQVDRPRWPPSGAWPPSARAIAANYEQLMLARVFIGVGEAAYGSVGLAVVLDGLPGLPPRLAHRCLHGRRLVRLGARRRSSAGSSPSSSAGAGPSASWPSSAWSWSCSTACSSTTRSSTRHRIADVVEGEPVVGTGERAKLRTLFSTPSVICAYIGSGLQLFIAGSLFAWLPSYLNRAYGLAPGQGRRHRRRRVHPVHGRRHDRVRRVTDRLSQDRRHPQVDDRHRLHHRSRWSSSASASPMQPGRAAAAPARRRRLLRRAAPPARPAPWSPT